MDVLVQINTAGEDKKYGVAFSEVSTLISDIVSECKAVRIKGLMSVVPIEQDGKDISVYFRKSKELFDKLASESEHDRVEMKYLSMGMTNDFEAAIKEGSNMVRVGTAIFGERNYI
jgi:pyridoxal phosphate enzyme (YggS family)